MKDEQSILFETSRPQTALLQSQHFLHGCTRKFTSNSYFLNEKTLYIYLVKSSIDVIWRKDDLPVFKAA